MRIGKWDFDWMYELAGLFSITHETSETGGWSLHLFPSRVYWNKWGRSTDELPLCVEYLGCGPVFLLCWIP